MKLSSKYEQLLLMVLISASTSIVSLMIYSKFFNRPVINYNSMSSIKRVSDLLTIDKSGFSEITKSVMPTIAFVQTIKEGKNNQKTIESGSGVVITSDGYIITNAHVIRDGKNIIVTTYDNIQYDAVLVGADEQTDIAVLKINKENLSFLFVDNSNNVEVGDISLAFGNPFRLRNSVSLGIISAKYRNLNMLGSSGIESFLQTDALANSGNSGGALVNTSGKLIGLISAVNFENDIDPGFTFAIPSNIVKKVAFDLITFRAVQRVRLGISVRDTGNKDFYSRGAVIQSIENESVVAKAGIQIEDIIFRIDSLLIDNASHFQAIVSEKKPGDEIKITYMRDGKEYHTGIILKNAFNTDELISNRKDKILADLGMTVRELTKNESKTLKTDGVLVVSIKKGSSVGLSNMEPDYLIEELNSERVTSVDELIDKINKSGSSLRFNGFYRNYPGKFPYVVEK